MRKKEPFFFFFTLVNCDVSENVEKGLPAPIQLGPARVLELGAGSDRDLPEQGPRGRVRKRGAGSP